MKHKKEGRALFHTRDSGGKHEQTPAQYVNWARSKCGEFDVSFDGTPEVIDAMIHAHCSVQGDIFLDFDTPGNVLSRKGLNALIETALADSNVTHVLIPRRDRLARPDDPIDGVKIENRLRRGGVALVFMGKIYPPLGKKKRQDKAELITAVMEYADAGEDRRELAQKILLAQISLATAGFSTGGRPPFGFRRWLVTPQYWIFLNQGYAV